MISAIHVTTPNRSLFREVNDRVRDVNHVLQLRPSTYDLVCECTRPECKERLPVPDEVYEALRLEDDRFVVALGHEDQDRVVVSTDSYSVVSAWSATDTAALG